MEKSCKGSASGKVLQTDINSVKAEFCSLLEDENNKFGWSCNEAKSSDLLKKLRRIVSIMTAAGYGQECCDTFHVRRAEKLSTDVRGFLKLDVSSKEQQKFEDEIVDWITAFRYMVHVSLDDEWRICNMIFIDHPDGSFNLFEKLVTGVIKELLQFVNVATETKKCDRMFGLLQMYEAMKDLMPLINRLFAFGSEKGEKDIYDPSSKHQADLQIILSIAKLNIEETIVDMFDAKKLLNEFTMDVIPDGAIDPITKFIMDFLKRVSMYTNSLEEVLHKHKIDYGGNDKAEYSSSLFAVKLNAIMDLLYKTINFKSKFYMDQSLGNIFQINNGHYMLQNLSDCSNIKELLGDQWDEISKAIPKNIMDYSRNTWKVVLDCFIEEGLHVQGTTDSAHKVVLKERLQSFNVLFEEIIKKQSMWIINDKKLRTDLRVTVQHLVVQGYRSFVGRYRHNLDLEQMDKYIKYEADDIVEYIDELFEGRPSSITKRR